MSERRSVLYRRSARSSHRSQMVHLHANAPSRPMPGHEQFLLGRLSLKEFVDGWLCVEFHGTIRFRRA